MQLYCEDLVVAAPKVVAPGAAAVPSEPEEPRGRHQPPNPLSAPRWSGPQRGPSVPVQRGRRQASLAPSGNLPFVSPTEEVPELFFRARRPADVVDPPLGDRGGSLGSLPGLWMIEPVAQNLFG